VDEVVEPQEVHAGLGSVLDAEREPVQLLDVQQRLVDLGVLEADALFNPPQRVHAGPQVLVEPVGLLCLVVAPDRVGHISRQLRVIWFGQCAPHGTPVRCGEGVVEPAADLEPVAACGVSLRASPVPVCGQSQGGLEVEDVLGEHPVQVNRPP